MRYFLLLLLMTGGIYCIAQPTAPTLKKLGNSGGKTWAVVIGISDYQDKDIPNLSFAHRDAEAFAAWLQSSAGGSLDGDQMQVLLNEQASAGRVAEALDALIERVQENDKVFIYFSGHGDVERKTYSQPGFLLCWDAPSRVYMGGGTYSLTYLQEIVTTLTLQNMAKVTVIADACRAGKLAGSQVGGPQLTAANLMRQQANEMKILSCQPEEYSLEGVQWGGGRGVFSYHLMDGLYGLADRNDDGVITLGELDRYLEDHVTAQAAPISQVPVLLGNKSEKIALIHDETLADLTRIKSGEMVFFKATDSRGLEEEVLENLDPGIMNQYMAFKVAVIEKRFFQDSLTVNSKLYADELYSLLIVEPGLSPLYGAMTRNYAAALQDDAQQTLNGWLKTSQETSIVVGSGGRLPRKLFTAKVRSYPRCLERAAELLGAKHYMYAALMARKYFFEGYILAKSNQNPNQELGGQALALFRQSLEWQEEQPHVYGHMSQVFCYNFLEPNSLEYYAWRAMEVYPTWVTPCIDAAFCLFYRLDQIDRARPFLEHASRIDSNSAEVLCTWGQFNTIKGNFLEAEQQLKKAIGLDSTFITSWNSLGYLYNLTRRYEEAEPVLKKAVALDSTNYTACNNLGFAYINTRRYKEAEPVLKKAILLDSMRANPRKHLGIVYFKSNRPAEARQHFLKAIELNSNYAPALLGLAYLLAAEGKVAEALWYIEQAIGKGSTFEQLESDEDLAPLRALPEWEVLVKKYFPDQNGN